MTSRVLITVLRIIHIIKVSTNADHKYIATSLSTALSKFKYDVVDNSVAFIDCIMMRTIKKGADNIPMVSLYTSIIKVRNIYYR